MNLAYKIGGGETTVKKYQVHQSVTAIGVPMLIPGAGNAGLVAATTTGAADMVGCNLDVATYVTSQQTDGTSTKRVVTVIINPNAVWIARMSGGATAGTALTLFDVTTASSTGLSVTTGDDFSSPTMDEGYGWGYDGANAGQARKITSVSTSAFTVTNAFDQDTVVGDNFLVCPYSPIQGITVQLTSDLTEADASIAVGTGAGFKTVELVLNDLAQDGRTQSYVLMVPTDHVWGPRPT